MSNTFFISDMHLNHGNVLRFDNRPFPDLDTMHEQILLRWNNVVTNADDVYILGDMVWKLDDKILSLVSRLKGKMHLLTGNHDGGSLKDYRFKKLFEEIVPYKELKLHTKDNKHTNVVLSHFPIMMWNGQHRGSIHLYGHVHNSMEDTYYQHYLNDLKANMNKTKDENFNPIAINVGCMMSYMNYTPQTLEQILKKVGINNAS